jgi:hypothetical protein
LKEKDIAIATSSKPKYIILCFGRDISNISYRTGIIALPFQELYSTIQAYSSLSLSLYIYGE